MEMNGISTYNFSKDLTTEFVKVGNGMGVETHQNQFDAHIEFCIKKNLLLGHHNLEKLLELRKNSLSWDALERFILPGDFTIITYLFNTAVKFWEQGDHTSCKLKLAFTLRTRNNKIKRILAVASAPISSVGSIDSINMGLFDISFLGSQLGVIWEICNNEKEKVRFRTLFNQKFENIFTKREVEVIEMICNGKTTQEIASTLFLSQHTIATHRKNILRKSSCHNAQELFAFCRERGIIS